MTDFDSQLRKMSTTVQSGQGLKSGRGICKYCGKQIIASKEIVTTSGDVFHPEHFLCSSCHKALATNMHYPFEGEYYCPTCWESRCPTCAKCGKPIVSGPKINAIGKVWHVDHFRCTVCDCQIEGSFAVHDGKPFCPEHAQGLGETMKCTRCGQPITKGQYFNNSDGSRHWHFDCFVCAACKMPFPNGKYFEANGDVYCQLHYHTVKGSVCAACGLPVVGDALEANGAIWHVNCFKCAACQKPLKGLSFHLVGGKAHCVECTALLHPGAVNQQA